VRIKSVTWSGKKWRDVSKRGGTGIIAKFVKRMWKEVYPVRIGERRKCDQVKCKRGIRKE
jgi:hypothetical protein